MLGLGVSLPKAPILFGLGAAKWSLGGVPGQINMVAAPKNNFASASWTKTDVFDTTFATKTSAPDGTLTASKMIEDTTASAFHFIMQKVVRAGTVAQTPFRFMLDLKAAGRTRVNMSVLNGISGTAGVQCVFDLAGGQIGVAANIFGSGWTAVGSSITPIGNGFYRCILDATPDSTTTTIQCQVALDNGSGTAALSQQYTGNGTAGVYVWQASLLPKVAWSIGRRSFYDDFTSLGTIDTANTKQAGHPWYLSNPWASATAGAGNAWRVAPSTQAGDLSVSNSVLTIPTDRTTFPYGIATAVSDGASGYVGATFTAPALFQSSFSFNPALATSADVSWPAFWGISTEFLTGNLPVSPNDLFFENDFFEAIPQSTAGLIDDFCTAHQWAASAVTSNVNSNAKLTPNWPSVTWTSQNVVASLWLSASSNGGIGLRMTFANGTFVPNSEVSWTAAGAAKPGATPSNPAGTFAIGDAEHLVMILGAGPSRPINVDFAAVYQT